MNTTLTLQLAVLSLASWPVSAASCESLASLALPATKITLAEVVPAGSFSPPQPGAANPYQSLPAFCRVAATLRPTDDSDIQVECAGYQML